METHYELIPPAPTLRIEFFRHDRKEERPGISESDPKDILVPLTTEGRTHAREVGQRKNTHPEVGLAWASPRNRAIETALHQLLSNEDQVTPHQDLAALTKLTGEVLSTSGYSRKKYSVKPELDFDFYGTERYGQALDKAYDEERLMEFLAKESDTAVVEYHDSKSSTYSRMAGNIARLLKKCLTTYSRWEQIVKKDPTRFLPFNNELQRFAASHAGILESFLMKVIEKTDGQEALEKFYQDRPNGFNYSEGFTVYMGRQEVKNEPHIKLKYNDHEWDIPTSLLDQMIEEKGQLDRQVSEKSKGEVR